MYKKVDVVKRGDNKQKTGFDLFLLKVFFEDNRWVHANPTLYQSGHAAVLDRYKTFFCESKKVKTNLARMYRYVTNSGESHGKFVCIKGKRGSGKTSFINYFFNKYTASLNNKGYAKNFRYEHKPLTWIRIDATKVYKYNLNHNVPIDFNDYLYAQLLFVYFRYGQDEGTDIYFPDHASGGANGCSHQGSFSTKHHDTVLASVKNEFESKVKTDPLLQKQYDNAKEMAASSKVPQFSNGIEGKPFECLELGKVLFELVKDRLIVVIDGIDNIHYDSVLKENAWDYLESFLKDFGATNPRQKATVASAHKVVLAMRDENLEYFAHKLPHLNLRVTEEQEITTPIIDINEAVTFTDVMTRFRDYIRFDDEQIWTNEEYYVFLRKFLTLYKTVMLNLFDDDQIKMDQEGEHSIKTFLTTKLTEEMLTSDKKKKELTQLLENAHFFLTDAFVRQLKMCGYEMGDQIKQAIRYRYRQGQAYIRRSQNATLKHRVKHQPITYYFEFAEALNDIIRDAFKTKAKFEFASDNMLQHFFNGDLREMMIVSYKAYGALVDYMLNEDPKMKDKEDYTEFQTYIKARVLYVMRSLFKNGNVYYPDRSEVRFFAPYRNINVINLLNVCNLEDSPRETSYFFYILAYLAKGERSLQEITNFFRLAERQASVEKILNNYLEYGYVEYKEIANQLQYRATTKGEAILRYSFSDITVLQAYIFGGLVPSSIVKFFKKPDKGTFASSIQFNTALLYYLLKIEAGNLYARDIKLKELGLTIITPEAKEDFVGYFETNRFLFSDIRDAIGDTKDTLLPPSDPGYEGSLATHLIAFVREELLGYKEYEKWFDDKHKRALLQEELSLEERYVYVKEFLAEPSEETIVRYNMPYCRFVFGGLPETEEKEEENIQRLKEIEILGYYEQTKMKVAKLAVQHEWVHSLAQ